MKTLIWEFSESLAAKQQIKNDGVIAFPTETVYGLGCRYDSFLAYNKIFEIKDRDGNKALTLMLHDKNDILKYAQVDSKLLRVINKFMPGAITIVVPIKEDVEIIGCTSTVGIRIPDSKELLAFLKNMEIPLFVTSANISGQRALVNYDDVYETFNNKIAGIVKGDISNGQASTVVSFINNKISILRAGPISIEQIEKEYYDE
ncbi:MAG: threonylcarbamoyl-AMP synthase [Bacilli bacterium]|jgi:L-threonylcarbamoyladenylate synthase|nr:threonylcarbamoyl-AMP synthase [Bacilli bacterium]